MPTLGADMTEATLVEWLVDEGENIRRGDIIAEVETGKGIIEIEVFEDGIFERMLVRPGETVAVGTVIAIIRATEQPQEPDQADHGRESPEQKTPPADKTTGDALKKTDTPAMRTVRPLTEQAPEDKEPRPTETRLKISPRARKKARELGIDPEHIKGSGPQGVIIADDIRKEETALGSPETTWPQGRDNRGQEKIQERMRRAIAKATARSNREIPHYYLQTRIDMHRALTWLSEYNRPRPVKERILPAVLGLKAVALAARKVPDLNGFWIDSRLQPSKAIHVGVAISLRGGGLIAPAIHDVDTQGLDDLMHSLHDLITRARSGRLRGSEITDATITLTSLGDRGVETVYGIIYPPQLALVGVGKIMDQPWAENGMLTVRPVVSATLSADHRATDGHTGSLFLEALNHALQRPEKL